MSAITNRWAIQRVFSIKLFDLTTGENVGYLTDLKQSNFTNAGTVVYASGGPGNPKLAAFEHSKDAKMSAQNAAFDNAAVGSQIGATPVVGVNTNLVYTDIVTISGNVGITNFTALGTAGAEIKYAYLKNTDGTLGTKYTQDAIVGAGKFTYTPGTKTIAFNAAEVADNAEVVIFYNATAAATAVTLSNYADRYAKSCKMVADSLVRDLCTQADYAAQIIFYQGKINPNFELGLTSDGNPGIHNFEIDALKACANTKLWDLIIYDESTVT